MLLVGESFILSVKYFCLSYYPAYDVTLFYVKKKDELIGREVDENTVIAKMTDMAEEYRADGFPGMTNHVHLQLELHGKARDDPERFVDPTHLRC